MSTPVIYTADVQGDESLFSLSEICERCGVHADIVVEMVEYGIVTPAADQAPAERWQFSTDALLRMRRAQRLLSDLELNPPGLALHLELLDQIDELQQQVGSLKHQLQELLGGSTSRAP